MFDNYVVEIEDNNILNLSLMKRLPIKKEAKILKSIMTTNQSMNINVNVHRKKVYVIVEGEEVYIKLVTIPKVNYNEIDDLIRGEMLYYFKDIESILYSYSILKEYDKSIEVIVFCLNADKVDVLKKSLSDFSKIKGIYLIQFCISNFIKKAVNEDSYNAVFYSRGSLYLLEVKDNVLKKNKLVRGVSTAKEFKLEIEGFISQSQSSVINNYFLNIEDKEWIKEFSYDKCFIDLGNYCEKNIIESFTLNR